MIQPSKANFWNVCGIYPLPTGFMMAPQYSALVFETLLLAPAVGYFISDALQSRRLAGPKMWKVNDIVQVLVMIAQFILWCTSTSKPIV